MYLPAPSFVNPGKNAWQLTAATLVGLQTIPGLAILCGGLVKRKWAVSSALFAIYASAARARMALSASSRASW